MGGIIVGWPEYLMNRNTFSRRARAFFVCAFFVGLISFAPCTVYGQEIKPGADGSELKKKAEGLSPDEMVRNGKMLENTVAMKNDNLESEILQRKDMAVNGDVREGAYEVVFNEAGYPVRVTQPDGRSVDYSYNLEDKDVNKDGVVDSLDKIASVTLMSGNISLEVNGDILKIVYYEKEGAKSDDGAEDATDKLADKLIVVIDNKQDVDAARPKVMYSVEFSDKGDVRYAGSGKTVEIVKVDKNDVPGKGSGPSGEGALGQEKLVQYGKIDFNAIEEAFRDFRSQMSALRNAHQSGAVIEGESTVGVGDEVVTEKGVQKQIILRERGRQRAVNGLVSRLSAILNDAGVSSYRITKDNIDVILSLPAKEK